jgi:hypothetical protein
MCSVFVEISSVVLAYSFPAFVLAALYAEDTGDFVESQAEAPAEDIDDITLEALSVS